MAEKRGRVNSIQTVAPEVVVIDVAMVDPPTLEYQAGQFLSIRVDDKGDVRRSYSMSSSPARKDGFELLVKRVPGGAGSEFFRGLKPGDEIGFTGPMGFFVIDPDHTGDTVLVATGSGIAAALPMAIEALTKPRKVLLRWGLRKEQDAYWQDRLETLRKQPSFDYEIVRPPAPADWDEVHPLLLASIESLRATLADPMFYVVGNGTMTRLVRDALVASGVDRKTRIRNEIFYPVAEP